jgi:Tfp pilus assembly protein FimT
MNRTVALLRDARRNSLGFTLIELCVCVSIGATLVSQAVPSLSKMRQEQALRATSEALASDLRFARSEAARMGESVYFRVSGKGAQSCYVLHTGAHNDCDCAGGQAVCKVATSTVIKAEWLSPNKAMHLHSNAETLEFQHRQGLVTQTGSIEVALESGAGIRQVVAITGRVRSCSTGVKLPGIKKCA